MKTLFDDNQNTERQKNFKKEVTSLDKLKTLEDKITATIERVKAFKEEKILLERKIMELERLLDEKNQEVEQLRAEKNMIKGQIETLLNELETLELE